MDKDAIEWEGLRTLCKDLTPGRYELEEKSDTTAVLLPMC
jgi:hypothetical protein